MNKLKSPKELMAERNPLARKAVEPVDIYSQPTPAEVDTPKKESKQPTEPVQTSSKPKAKKEASPKNIENFRHYSTYLTHKQVKGIKLRAIEQDVHDFAIVQAAIDEYFQKHPL